MSASSLHRSRPSAHQNSSDSDIITSFQTAQQDSWTRQHAADSQNWHNHAVHHRIVNLGGEEHSPPVQPFASSGSASLERPLEPSGDSPVHLSSNGCFMPMHTGSPQLFAGGAPTWSPQMWRGGGYSPTSASSPFSGGNSVSSPHILPHIDNFSLQGLTRVIAWPVPVTWLPPVRAEELLAAMPSRYED